MTATKINKCSRIKSDTVETLKIFTSKSIEKNATHQNLSKKNPVSQIFMTQLTLDSTTYG